MPLPDIFRARIVHVYRVRLFHQLCPSTGTSFISEKRGHAGRGCDNTRSRSGFHALHHLRLDAVLLLVIEQKLLAGVTRNKQKNEAVETGRHTSLALDGPQLLPDESGSGIDLSGGLNSLQRIDAPSVKRFISWPLKSK